MEGYYWHYLYEEDLFYLSFFHPEEGIEGEWFFQTRAELDAHLKENNITDVNYPYKQK